MRAFARWYNDMDAGRLALQAVKYQSRDGWSHRDVLRKAHPVAPSAQHQAIYHWMVKGWDSVGETPHPDRVLATIWAFERAKRMKDRARRPRAVRAGREYGLPHECVPTEMKQHPEVWEALLPHMGLTAMLRNLGKMTEVGLLGALSEAERVRGRPAVATPRRCARRACTRSRCSSRCKTYAQGHGDKGKLTWKPRQKIVDALDRAFYLSFETLAPTGARTLLPSTCRAR